MRPVYLALGLGFVALGYLGLVLPVMPGTIFFILALNCFRRSNAKLEHWILYRTRMGPTLRDWDERGAISPKAKRIAVGVLWLSIIGSCASVYRQAGWDPALKPAVAVVLVVTAYAVSRYILTRPNA